MASIIRKLTREVRSRLDSAGGLGYHLAQVSAATGLELKQWDGFIVAEQNIGPELSEKTLTGTYPSLFIYVENLSNQRKEKFRTFSGKGTVVIELRVSSDRADTLQQESEAYVEAVTNVLDNHTGYWGNGLYYDGQYDITIGPIKRGGKNYLQITKIKLTVDIVV